MRLASYYWFMAWSSSQIRCRFQRIASSLQTTPRSLALLQPCNKTASHDEVPITQSGNTGGVWQWWRPREENPGFGKMLSIGMTLCLYLRFTRPKLSSSREKLRVSSRSYGRMQLIYLGIRPKVRCWVLLRSALKICKGEDLAYAKIDAVLAPKLAENCNFCIQLF
ncbi:hypothetical protein VTN77DRAFT_5033 [Rasamsonia byssochlamydoides]|uniref:uncharacterized protein n=1 Tax=Rasamsonia byssochlamydoides TaxID=89139 RepID=UPI0037420941